jgi:hypothetical protein
MARQQPMRNPVSEPTTKFVRIRRRFAVWLEDCIDAPLPAGVDPTDNDAVQAWALENYDRLYTEVKQRHDEAEFDPAALDETNVSLLWEDEHKADLDFPEDEIEAEVL